MSMTDLHGFDALARREIDAALDRVAAENSEADYLVKSNFDGGWTRTSCSLSIRHTNPTMQEIDGSIVIRTAGDRVVVEHYFRWLDHGKATQIATIDAADVTKERIMSLARDFVVEFFRRLPEKISV